MVVALCRVAGAAELLPAGVEVKNYSGWNESIYLDATEKPVRAVVVPAVGGRVARFSLAGENILFENPASLGRTLGSSQEELWLGGAQCDVGPPGLPPHPALLEGRYGWDLKDFSAHVTSEPDRDLGVVLEKNFVLAPDTGDLGVVQRVRNISQDNLTRSLVDRTICPGGGFIFFPLNKQSRFPAGWSQRRVVDGNVIYDGDHPDAFQVRVLDGVLVVSAVGDVTALGADTMAGWIAYTRGKILFVKYFPCFGRGRYSNGGNTVEIYFNQRAVELSPRSPETTLAPGQSYAFPEQWTLIELKKEARTWEEARKLVKKIPKSPFAGN